ncbi:YggT family protein [Dactylosporangium sp. NPDC049140]|uniref:YggT family protein n=1 Tax=Dactylosporangium sp. NPDC049140 TaxID=3155647 RepID=UPI0033F95517
MGLVLGIVSLALLVFQLLLIARALLDWSVMLAGPSAPGGVRSKLIGGVWRVTEPVLAPVRRALPPLRLGGVGIDLAFIVVFLGIILLRAILGWLY